jgi:hypothetical protein
MLGGIAVTFVVFAFVLVWTLRRIAPAASIALVGAVGGGIAGCLIRASDRPTFAPVAAAGGATLGLVAFGIGGLIVAASRSTRSTRRRAALAVLCGGIASAGALTFLLLMACPLYVMHAGYCSHGDVDVLGGWISGVIALYVFDIVALTALVLASSEWPGSRAADA